MADPHKTPHVSQELIDYLTRLYPNRCPKLTDSDREIWASAGSAAVVEHLRRLLDKQTKESLGSLTSL